MNTYFSSTFKLGILGGGQLGRMLLRETNKFDIRVRRKAYVRRFLCSQRLQCYRT